MVTKSMLPKPTSFVALQGVPLLKVGHRVSLVAMEVGLLLGNLGGGGGNRGLQMHEHLNGVLLLRVEPLKYDVIIVCLVTIHSFVVTIVPGGDVTIVLSGRDGDVCSRPSVKPRTLELFAGIPQSGRGASRLEALVAVEVGRIAASFLRRHKIDRLVLLRRNNYAVARDCLPLELGCQWRRGFWGGFCQFWKLTGNFQL